MKQACLRGACRRNSVIRRACVAGLTLLVATSCSRSAESADGAFEWTITTEVEIDAPPATVWQVLVDLDAYPQWNPFIVAGSGTVAPGETLSLRMALPGRDPMTIEPRLLVVEHDRELRWKGRLWLPGLFDGEHAFVLTRLEPMRTRVEHWERFSGVLLPIAKRLIYDDTVEAFHLLNGALAERAARLAPPPAGLRP
jgi:hypothetical protein